MTHNRACHSPLAVNGLSAGGKKPFMVFGADVTHPGVGSPPNTPSIAAVVGSMDSVCGRYASRIQMQVSAIGSTQPVKSGFWAEKRPLPAILF
eukprot:scaffold529651_cov36-Prasinocladus_malaysianus.AAC.2